MSAPPVSNAPPVAVVRFSGDSADPITMSWTVEAKRAREAAAIDYAQTLEAIASAGRRDLRLHGNGE